MQPSTGFRLLLATGLFAIVTASVVHAAPQGRLLLGGPYSTTGPDYQNEIHNYCLETRQRHTFAMFPTNTSAIATCPDGALYATDTTTVYKLDRASGQVISSFSHQTPTPVSIACKPNGNLLIAGDGAIGNIDEYTPSGTRTTWVSGLSGIIRSIRITPQGTVAFLEGDPSVSPNNKIVEYGLAGNHLRDVLTSSDKMDSFVFRTASEILVSHRGSQCLKRYDWTTTPATFAADFVCDASRISATWLGIHPIDGSIFGADHLSACVHAWDASGALLYGGQPLGCYVPRLYAGEPLVLADPCIPTLSEWGVGVMVLLLLTAGTVVAMKRGVRASP